jgi:stage IV sporulation protein B
MEAGEVFPATVVSVKKGAVGTPGQLMGAVTATAPIGYLSKNTQQGIYALPRNEKSIAYTAEPLPMASKNQIKPGAATIRSTVDGLTCQEYDIQIEKIDLKNNDTKNYVICIVDEDLLALTGGIVQGMSGSPILQDGRIVGALTHVLIGDPKTGYGIFIGNMLSADTLS